MNTLQNQLKKWCNKNGVQPAPTKKRKKRSKPPKTPKKLSTREVEELMGSRRPTYSRHRGALRQK